MSDRIAVINDGELQQCSPPLVCYNEPANTFVGQFIGSPSMNLFDGTISGGALDVESFDVRFEAGRTTLRDHGRVTVGVRPEDIYLADTDANVAHPSESVRVTVDVLEPVGDQTYAYLIVENDAHEGETELLMSVDPSVDITENDTVDVVFSRDDVHVFDGETGDALVHSLVESMSSGDGATARGES